MGDPVKKALLAVLLLAAAALLAAPAQAVQYNNIRLDPSQGYLRMGLNDSMVINVQLMDENSPVGVPGVPIAMSFKAGEDFVTFDNALFVTNDTGQGSAVMRLNPDNLPARYKLPIAVMVEASVIGNANVFGVTMIYITSTGPIWGYVVDDRGSTITGARITVTTPDGKPFPGGPFTSSDGTGSPMGYFRIDNLPVELLSGYSTLVATKNGFQGTTTAEAGDRNNPYQITINGYRDTIDVPSIVLNNSNATATPVPAPVDQPGTQARPTTMTATILMAIALITVVYIGLKAYRRMF